MKCPFCSHHASELKAENEHQCLYCDRKFYAQPKLIWRKQS